MQTREEKLEELRNVLEGLDAPSERKKLQTDMDIHWLGRNLAMNNPPSDDLTRAKTLLKEVGARMVL